MESEPRLLAQLARWTGRAQYELEQAARGRELDAVRAQELVTELDRILRRDEPPGPPSGP